ncbi:alpha/beta hydrolase [Mogibacterium neglectum]|uniref:alpha/beta hydrolase n=1 Tax=Mogibacterium neglectum TaxID=114528 RepID=UPI00272C4535|nr:alpha/beta hydrolase [Mogibacterium neglectum]WLD75694.1 alpha/beta hydrolase [Mogibacterium neglectum]
MLDVKNITVSKGNSINSSRRFTLYYPSDSTIRTLIVYIHGGGLLCGNANDLPGLHKERLIDEGYAILAIDYPLAPQAKIDSILEDIINSINNCFELTGLRSDLPLFVWGRSAGAYLALLASASNQLHFKLNGIISYYGYGFLCDGWYDAPSPNYMKLPLVEEGSTKIHDKEIVYRGDIATYFSTYIYARQTGKWKDLIYEGRDKYFFLLYTLRAVDSLPAPLFAAHSTGDTDVPYSEFIALCNKYHPDKFVVSIPEHDFDRNTNEPETVELLNKTISFVSNNI